MTTKSPRPAGRSTVSSLAERSRSALELLASIASSGTSGSRRPTSRPLYSPSSAFGRTPISIEKRQRLALAGQLGEVEVRLADRDDVGVVDRGGVPAAQRVADGLVEHRLAADALEDHGRRRLAGAEAGHAQVAGELARGLLDALLDLGGGHLRLDAHARLGELGDGGGDGGGPCERPPLYKGRRHALPASSPGGTPARSATSWPACADWAELLSRWWWSRLRERR